MKILVASINFAPDHSGIGVYSTDLPVFFAEHGHGVTMVTGFPFYPNWKKRDADMGKVFARENYHGVKVLRGYLYVPRRVTTLQRIAHELSFSLFCVLNFVRAGRQDCIVVISPPLLLGLVGVIFKWLWNCPLVFHIQDLQPDAAMSLNMIQPGLVIRMLVWLESVIYRYSTLVVTITNGMWQRLIDKGVPQEKLAIFYNWIDVKEASKPGPKGRFRNAYRFLRGKFVVAYAGNIGVKQGVEALLNVAKDLACNPQVHFLIIGEGADKQRLMQRARVLTLKNVTFLPFMEQVDYFDMLEDIDISFVSQRSGTGNVFFPSKLLGIMAKSKPLMISADPDSELATVIRESDCGVVVAPGDERILVDAITRFLEHPDELKRLGHNGFLSVMAYDRVSVLSKFMEKIASMQGELHERTG
jgi:colanic acid biosynthesis glycosyl transferase WcaI